MTEASGTQPTTAEQRFAADVAWLVASDAHLAQVVEGAGVPPYWSRPGGFPTMVLFVLEQQVSLASAAATFRKLADLVGGMTPEHVLAASEMRSAGVSRQKERYLRALADAVVDGSLDLPSLEDLSDDDVATALMRLPGIGRWTADVYLLACLGRPDLWPVGDRALQVAAAETLGMAEVPSQTELEAIGERWRPHRSTAARILWHGYLVRRGRVETPNDLIAGVL